MWSGNLKLICCVVCSRFDSELQLLHDELRQEKQQKDRTSREKELLIAEKYSLEQNLSVSVIRTQKFTGYIGWPSWSVAYTQQLILLGFHFGSLEDILGNVTTEVKELLEIFVFYIFSAIDKVSLPKNSTTNVTYPCIQETTVTSFGYFVSPSLGSTDIQRRYIYIYLDLRSRMI